MPRNGMTCPYCKGAGAVATKQNPQGEQCQACDGTGEQLFLRLKRWYHLFDGTLTALQTQQYTMQIDSDADFEWLGCVATFTGTFQTTMRDGSSGRNYESPAANANPTTTSGAVNNGNRFGDAKLPFLLPVPEVLPKRTTMNGSIIDTSNATNVIQASLIGYDLYTQDNLPPGMTADQLYQAAMQQR